jgi:AraC-like DNA-binding protein
MIESSQLGASLPTRVRARSLTGFVDLVTRYGGDSAALLTRVGIDHGLLDTPEATLEHAKLISLLELAAQVLSVSDFGLQLAELQGISVLGPVALMAQHAATVGQALEVVQRNIPYHSPGAEVHLGIEPLAGKTRQFACLRYELHLPIGTADRQNSELAYAIVIDFLRMVSNQPSTDWQIHFVHGAGLDKGQYRKHLGCEVRLSQKFNALFFPAELLNTPIDAADPALVATAERFVSHVVRRHPLDIAMQVETLLIRQLAGSAVTLPRIAHQLSMSIRSLQRRLQEHDSSFDQIADRVRRNRAYELLTQTQIPLAQIGSALGYTESSTFNRACQRWFNATPLKYRQLHQG